jgi:competence protein ComEA
MAFALRNGATGMARSAVSANTPESRYCRLSRLNFQNAYIFRSSPMKPRSFIAAFLLIFSLTTSFAHASEPVSVNINTADAVALSSLNGIGESKAQAIVSYREANGPFESIEQLSEVKGIGARTVEKNAERMAVE